MPLFMCARCGCFDNTATSGYWIQQIQHFESRQTTEGFEPLCSEHNPTIGAWHGEWEKQRAEGFVQDQRGFIYKPEEASGYFKHLGPFKPVVLPAGPRPRPL